MAETTEFLLERIRDAKKEIESLLEGIDKNHKACSCSLKWFDFDASLKNLTDLIMKCPEAESLYYLYHLNNVTADWQKQLKKPPGFNQIPCLGCRVRKSINKITEEVQSSMQEVQSSTSKVKGADAQSSMPKGADPQSSMPKGADQQSLSKVGIAKSVPNRWSSPTAVPEKTYGIDDRVMIMETLLLDEDSSNAIGVLGMAGVGKTALCQKAFNNPRVKKHFFPRIWVPLSKQPTDPEDPEKNPEYPKEVVKRMLVVLGFEENIIKEAGRQCDLNILLMALRKKLMGQRYLIVLDDVWNSGDNVKKFCTLLTDDVDEQKQDGQKRLAYGLPKGHGSKVIVNSRYRNIAETMVGEKNLLHLLPLADKQKCWDIFMDAGDDALPKESTPDKEKIKPVKEKIVNNCDGLPLLAKMMRKLALDKKAEQEQNRQNETKKAEQEQNRQNETQKETQQKKAED